MAETIDSPVKKRRWLRYLIISLSVLVVLGLTAILLIFSYYKSLISKYTQPQAQALPAFKATDEDIQRLKSRWAGFQQQLQSGRAAQPFKLSADDLNTILTQIPELGERMRFAIENDTLKGHFSMPLDQSGKKELQGRYLNGEVTFDVSLRADGFPDLRVAKAVVNGKPPPGWLMKRLKAQDFLKDVNRNPDLQAITQNLEAIKVEDNHLVLTPVGNP